MSCESLPRVPKTTEEDPVIQTLKNTILLGWPDCKEEVPKKLPGALEFQRGVDTP